MEFKTELKLSNIFYSGDMARNTISNLTKTTFGIELGNHIRNNVSIPVIASNGAGKVEHFSDISEKTDVEISLDAGIFHSGEVPI